MTNLGISALVSILALGVGCGDQAGDDSAAPLVSTGTTRFVVLGDAGTGSEAQYAVGEAMVQVCAERTDDLPGCDYALYMGDNFYNDGVDSVDDEQFQTKFELPYADLDIPFYAALGNHDYGGEGLGSDWEQPDAQVAYSDVSDKWIMDDRYYQHDQAHVSFFVLDTNAILWDSFWNGAADQLAWLEQGLADSDRAWRVAYGHHPYLSNGEHGSAGAYEGVEDVPVYSGGEVRDFVESGLCGKVDVYLSGHDHNLEWLEPSCGTQFIVSGAGGKLRDMVGWGAPSQFEYADAEGFLWVEIRDETFTGVFYDRNAQALFEASFTR
ncbi:MAG: metallophosphoesterase [Myxococcota bacterium]|jgi:hypothetical protein|nr:metallophosphoesterase [Myxococcota bacterium]